MVALPESPDAFKDSTWEDILPYYEELASRRLDRANVEAWLADWSLFESLLSEAGALASFAYSCDTSDPAREAAQLRFGVQISPKAREQRVRLQERLVQLNYVRPGLETTVQRRPAGGVSRPAELGWPHGQCTPPAAEVVSGPYNLCGIG